MGQAPARSEDTATDTATAVQTARDALSAEWTAAQPQTPEDITRFYTTSTALAGDLEAWHQTPARQQITQYVVRVAQQNSGAHTTGHEGPYQVIDIGCGAGEDLLAIRTALPQTVPLGLLGVEPNRLLADKAWTLHGIATVSRVAFAPLEQADLLICIDVLEHVPDPDAFLADIAERAPVGCVLFEATASFDLDTPVHLRANAGWHPGHVLERYGWTLADKSSDSRLRVWRRAALTNHPRASLLLCAYRSVTPATLAGVVTVLAAQQGWRLRTKAGDAMISRSRAIVTTGWYRETDDDVFLMIDDDILFAQEDAEHIVGLCRQGYDIVCGAYPVHNGAHLACRLLPNTTLTFGPGQEPVEIAYAATGFLAVRRAVIATLVKDMPLCHAKEPWSFYPLYPHLVLENDAVGGHEYTSEDYGLCHIARAAGFKVWVDPTIILGHDSSISVSVANMRAVHAAITGA